MIAACPRCSARYRIEPERLRSDGVRLRCSRCEAVFRVRPPVPKPAPTADVEPAPPQPVSVPDAPIDSAAARSDRAGAAVGENSEVDRSRLVLIADPEVENGKATAAAVASWGLTPILVHDGVEAIMSIQRLLPDTVVMDAALPKMFGFQVCELVKRNASLCHIRVVLVGAIYNRERYRRAPSELYGADTYIERHELTEGLRDVLVGFGVLTGAAEPKPDALLDAAEGPRATAEPQALEPPLAPPVAAPIAVAPEQEVAAAEPAAASAVVEPAPEANEPPAASSPEVAAAERLARIVVSDIILYNQEKFDAAVRDGNVLAAMESDLAEGRSLFDSRIAAELREQRDFLVERLLEVARERGMS